MIVVPLLALLALVTSAFAVAGAAHIPSIGRHLWALAGVAFATSLPISLFVEVPFEVIIPAFLISGLIVAIAGSTMDRLLRLGFLLIGAPLLLALSYVVFVVVAQGWLTWARNVDLSGELIVSVLMAFLVAGYLVLGAALRRVNRTGDPIEPELA